MVRLPEGGMTAGCGGGGVLNQYPLLPRSDELWPSFRWRLVKLLYAQYRAMLEGSAALALVEAICAYRTGSSIFLALLAAVLATTAGRYVLTIWFRRNERRDYPQQGGTPEMWARRFVAGLVCSSILFGATTLVVCLDFHDPALQLLVFMVEGAWIAGSTQRNAASPMAVASQTAVISVTAIISAMWSGSPVVLWVVPFVVAHMLAARSALAFFGDLHLNTLLTEQRLEAANAQLMELSSTDGLTGINNRRAFDAEFQREVGRAARNADTLALIMIDVDFFKAFNDRYGHTAGDACLREIAAITEGALHRPRDFAARFGGEEFAVMLPGTPLEGACDVAERIRRSVLHGARLHAGSPFGHVTISLGVASTVPKPGSKPQHLIDVADQALYQAKKGGRNQVCVAGAPQAVEGLRARQ
jgi:diguanylate cyclase (GGDEF)-like protein